ncbi:MAG: DUF6441 family protein [Magnetospirillum sp. WYHS-4]
MNGLPHLASRLLGTPLKVAHPKLDVILGVLGPRLSGGALEPLDIGAALGRQLEIPREGIAILPVHRYPGQPLFILVPQVTVRKRLDVVAAADKWIAELPRLVARNWRGRGR